LFATWLAPSALPAASLRPLTTDDLARLEEVEEAALSPDGRFLVYAVRRPLAGETSVKQDFLRGNERADLWLMAAAGGKAQRITDGASDGSGFWGPVWSPDGERLALLSTRGGNVRLWLWDRSSRRLRLLHERGVNVQWADPTVVWVSDDELLCPLLPPGERPLHMTIEMQAAETAMREWPKAWKGRETTVSVVESGGPDDFGSRPQGQLALIDVTKGTARVLFQGNLQGFRLSPERRAIAFAKKVGVTRPDPGRLLEHMQDADYEAGLVSLEPGSTARLAAGKGLVTGSLRFARDGAVAFLGKTTVTDTRVYRMSPDGSVETLPTPELSLTAVMPGAGRELLVLATSKAAAGDAKKRADWWRVDGGGTPQNLTASMKSAPAQLVAAAAGGFVGVAEGDLWRIATDGSAPRNLTESFDSKVASIVWPAATGREAEAARELLLGVQRGRFTDLFRVDLESGKISPAAKPDPEAALLAYMPDRGAALFNANTRRGTSLWLSQPAFSGQQLVYETNTFLREVSEGELRQVEYRGLEGDPLKAWLMLPPDYREGTPVPLVAWVYAGSVARDTPSSLSFINRIHSLNLQLLAAHGYAVLMPSMPLKPEKEPSDPYLELTKGVLPAVDKAIELGIADPKRLGLMGQSYGGYSTYGLVTQTGRFKAAVALAGLSDLVSLYGQFDARVRYEPYPHERYFQMSIAESGQIRMGNPPWKDAGRYLRNSPLFYVDRVTTPLMIVQGDMDYVAMQQGEQFFTALYRQGKRAAFVRYWGEGHVLRGPANIRDMWQRIYAWLDEFLKPEQAASAAGGS